MDDIYEVIVGNIGTTYCGADYQYAKRIYAEYVRQSRRGYGRAAYESVYLISASNGDTLQEYNPRS